MAIVHIAIFDAVNAIAGGYAELHAASTAAPAGASVEAAIAQAAHDTLVALFPSQAPSFDAALADDLESDRRRAGEGSRHPRSGAQAAAAILALRRERRLGRMPSRAGRRFIPATRPGKWRQDPISQIPIALGAHWGEVEPFVMRVGRPVPRRRRRRRWTAPSTPRPSTK